MYRWMNKLTRKTIKISIIVLMLCAFISSISDGGYVYGIIISTIYGGLTFLLFLLLFGQKITIRDKEIILQTGIIRRKRQVDDLTMITTLDYVHSKYSIDRRRLLFSFKDAKKSVELRLQPLDKGLLVDVLKEIDSLCSEEIPIVFRKKDGKWTTD